MTAPLRGPTLRTESPTARSARTERLRIAVMVVGLLAIGVVLRAWIIGSSLGELNADEAYAGLQSIGVLRHGRFPVVIDGNVYSAALEAYLFSPVLVFAGGSVAVLKGLFVALWAAAAVATFGATRRLLDRRSATLATALVWLAPGALLVLSTRAYMCYALGLTVVVATVWATTVLADQAQATLRLSAIVGFLAGLAFYIHPMFITVVAPIVAVAAFVHRRDWRRWWLPASIAAVVANLPFIAWNAVNDWPSLKEQAYPPGSYTDRFKGFFTGLLPRGLGLRKFDGAWVLGKPIGLLLYVAIIAGVVYGCVVLVRASTRPSRWIVPAGLTCLLFMALLPHLIFIADGRYSIIPFPLMAIALGAAGTSFMTAWNRRRTTFAVIGLAVLWVALTTLPFLDRQNVSLADNPNAWQDRVIARLHELDIDRLAGYYWFVLPIEYRSDQQIRTAVAGNPYVIRFPDSQQLVQSAPPETVAFLFPTGQQDPGWFYMDLGAYRQEDLGGMILYIPFAAGDGA